MLSSADSQCRLEQGGKVWTVQELVRQDRVNVVQQGKKWFLIIKDTNNGFPCTAALGREIIRAQRPLTDVEKVGLSNRRVYNAILNFMSADIAAGKISLVASGIPTREEAIKRALDAGALVAMDGKQWAVYKKNT